MTSTEFFSNYIKKLSHPLQEIRERSLHLLAAKLRLGWEIDDELSGARELLEALLAWFHVQKPTLQREAIQLLLSTITTKAGNYIVKEYGVKELIASLNNFKHKIDEDASDLYQDLIEAIQFLNTVESDNNVNIPRLTLPSVASSESVQDSNKDYVTGLRNEYSTKQSSTCDGSVRNNLCNVSKDTDGIRLLLFPWVQLSSSDCKTMLLVEDALKLLKSTRRCCRFICDVFLRDFPPEIFLNRPSIVQNLLVTSDTGDTRRSSEALLVLLCLTQALCKRIFELSSIDINNDVNKILECKETDDGINIELQELAGDRSPDLGRQDDTLAALRQWPAPVYALDSMHAVLSTMARSVILVDPTDNKEVLDLKTLNICLSLVESLTQLLLECVSDFFWTTDHISKTHRDIIHKSCMVMRLLGDVLMKYRKSFSNYGAKSHHRAAWIRLVFCAERLLFWARYSALPPSSLMVALQGAQLDPALELFYPTLNKNICEVLQSAKISVDQEYKAKYRELSKLVQSMNEAVKFMKNKNNVRNTKDVFTCIKNALPAIELHLSETYLDEVADILLRKTKNMDLNCDEWSFVRSIALSLMAHNVSWVCTKFYIQMAALVKSVLVDEDINQIDNEKCLTLICDVSILTEICCHGISSKVKEVASSASEIMVYFLRGRLVLSEVYWWRLLASMLPILPLLQVYAAHDTELGQAICKSLEPDIAECMGISVAETVLGFVRLLFVNCIAVKMEAALGLCRMLGDHRYLPPRETLRTDVLLNALRRIEPQSFNIDFSSSPSKNKQTTGLVQILDVLKQDIVLDEPCSEYVPFATVEPSLEPSLRRSTLQQLAVMMRQQENHETFHECDGLKVIVAILRMSLMVDDYLAFPECSISCVSILNSVGFSNRHALAKVQDLPPLLIRVILVFPANDLAVLMSAQVLALVAWSGFALQVLDDNRCQVPALPASVVERTTMPFQVNGYWTTSNNAEHSAVEWLISDEEFRATLRVRWWCVWASPAQVVRGAPPPPAPLALRPAARDLALLQTAAPTHSATKALLSLENATSHDQVSEALNVLESYTHLVKLSQECAEFGALPWHHMQRFLNAPPASPRDTALLVSLLQFIVTYMDNVPNEGGAHNWIKSCFIGKDASIITLLSRDKLFPHQTSQDNIEVTQLHIHIVKVLLRCVMLLETSEDFDSSRLESLVKILLACLDRIDLRNFHMLGYLNELMRCVRYALNSRFCKLSEATLIECLKLVTRTLSGCAAGGGWKGQACRLDAMVALLAMLRQIREAGIPVQRWSDACEGDVAGCLATCAGGARALLRAAAVRVAAQLARYAQLMPQLQQAFPSGSLCQFAAGVFTVAHEANAVRAAAAAMLVALTARPNKHTDVFEIEILENLEQSNFLENCVEILVDFCSEKEYKSTFEPNVPISLIERRSELEVRSEKCADVRISPSRGVYAKRAPTAALVAAVADVLHNINTFKRCPVPAWNELGLYRLLFRCTSWSNGSESENSEVRAATCRVLVVASTHKCVRASLAATKDCLHNLMLTFTPLDEDKWNPCILTAKTQALLLLGSLLSEKSGGETVWQVLRQGITGPFFTLILRCLESDDAAFQDAGLFCLSQLAKSVAKRRSADKTNGDSCIEFLDNLKSPFADDYGIMCAGDRESDCWPEYLVEEICKRLTHLFQSMSMQENLPESSQDQRWCCLCSCLASLLVVSARSRLYCVHRQFTRTLLASLQAVRDRLSLLGQPLEILRNAHSNNNATLQTLYWLLSIISCMMIDCAPAKEQLAEDNMVLSLGRVWPWCMITEQLREAVVHLLLTFTNNCPKAWSAVCQCVGGRSLLQETCALLCREAALMSRAYPDGLLLACTRQLRHAADHHHCRAVIIKSPALVSLHRLRARPAALARQWAGLCAALARHADGAAAVLALGPRPAPLLAIAHAAHHPQLRASFLSSRECYMVHIGVQSPALVSLHRLRARPAALARQWAGLCAALARHADGAAAVLALGPRPAPLLAIAHAAHHPQLRASFLSSRECYMVHIGVQSPALVSLHRLRARPAALARQWAGLCAALARHADGAAAVLALGPRPAPLLAIAHAAHHPQLRASFLSSRECYMVHIGVQSPALVSLHRLRARPAALARQWAGLCAALARHADGAAAVLALGPRPAPLLAIAHAAHHPQLRASFLSSRECYMVHIGVQSPALVSLHRLRARPAALARQWAGLCAALARHADGAAAVLALGPRPAPLLAIAHAAHHPQLRASFLSSRECYMVHIGVQSPALVRLHRLRARPAALARQWAGLCAALARHADGAAAVLALGPRPAPLLAIAHAAHHPQLRASFLSSRECYMVHIGVQSPALVSLHRLRARPAALARQWAGLCAALARHADGAAAVLALGPRPAPLLAIAHAAHHPQLRASFLSSRECYMVHIGVQSPALVSLHRLRARPAALARQWAGLCAALARHADGAAAVLALGPRPAPLLAIAHAAHHPQLRASFLSSRECYMVHIGVQSPALVSLHRLRARPAALARQWAGLCAALARHADGAAAVLALGPRPAPLLAIAHAAHHPQLRASFLSSRECYMVHIGVQSPALVSLHRLRARPAALARQWAGLCAALARHADGAAAVLALGPRPAPLLAIAHAAHHPQLRASFLSSPELLELLSGTLLTGDILEVVSAARAVWALAANNHKAKLLLRSARMSSAVASALARVRRNTEPHAQRAIELLTYTNTVLQT